MRSCLITLALIFLASCHRTDSWHRTGHERYKRNVTQPPNHHRTKSRVLTSKIFHLPSGQTYIVKTPRASKSVACQPSANIEEIKNHTRHYKSEYNMVVNEFTNSNMDPTKKFEITKVEKVFNECLMQKYNYRQNQIKVELAAGESINEKMIFHGTSNAHTVTQKGFDERFSKKAMDFGAGIYFSDNSSKANEISKTNEHGLRVVLLCRVTLGKEHTTDSVKKYAHAPVGMHSVVSGSRYVIYRGEQAYPDYIITFREV